MKRTLLIIALFMQTLLLSAQSMEEGKKDIFYERYTSAENTFHQVLEKDPGNAEAWFWLTRSYLLQHDSATAADTLAKAPAEVLDEPYFQVASGSIFLNNNKKQEAVASFQKAIDATKGKDAGLLAAIADIHIDEQNGDPTYALDLLERAKKRDKKNAAFFISQGKAQRKLHDGTAAYQSFREAIDRNKQAADAYYEMGKIFVTQKNVSMYTDYFQQAVAADKGYAPAYYALYDHYLYRDPAKAKEYFKGYATNTEANLQLDYSYTDLLYLNKNYDSAIVTARKLISREGNKVQPRLYKLVAYSYEGKMDTATAFDFMQQYFQHETDSNFVIKDYENMAQLYAAHAGKEGDAIASYQKAINLSTDSAQRSNYYQQLAGLSKKISDNAAEARWQGRYYNSDPKASNVALFNWGIASYKAKDYEQADSVFGIYTVKYPAQGFGYYWRARSNAARDSAMERGLAVPYYQHLIDMINRDSMSATDKKWVAEAYGYLATYETNTQKNYAAAISYFEKLLELDPANEQAQKYIDILKKDLESQEKKSAAAK